METLAPPVVAVIVTCDPGEWFEETLRAFAAQDYPELSVLVLDAASEVDPTPRVGAVLPGAYVRRLPVNRGFGASANEVLSMVEGASMLLFCHDDVAPDPDALHIMVEESFRSNAGVVAPKLVTWDDPGRLLHVGMAVDKGGAVVDRVEPGEIDHGQHDAVRDVFLAPGGCTLVRADLFAELEGFDPEIFAMGEDLDLCWRAQVLGARVVVAPGARVRHLEMLASGRRRLPDDVRQGMPSDVAAPDGQGGVVGDGDVVAVSDATAVGDGATTTTAAAGGPVGSGRGPGVAARRWRSANRGAHRRVSPVTLQALQRRHELRATLKAYGPLHRIRVLPQVALLALAEATIALVAGHRDRAAALAHAWRWNLGKRRNLRAARSVVRAHRRLDDATVRRLQLRGSARVNAYVRRAVTHGLEAANLGGFDDEDDDVGASADAVEARAQRRRTSEGPRTSTRWVVLLVAWLVVVFGTRQLIGSGFPFVGQLLPFPSWAALVHHFVSGWQPTGVGTTDPTTPATGILGVAGMVLFGGVGLLQKIVVLGCIPVGALGMARLTRPLGTTWARVTSTVIYMAVPVPYDALASARWDALAVYAACPWILHLLGQASGVAPHDAVAGAGSNGAQEPDADAPTPGPPGRRWRSSLFGWSLALGLLDALVTSVAPSAALVTLAVAAGLAIGNVVVAGRAGLRAAGRVIATAAGATVVAVVLLAPWSLAVLGGPARWQTLAGVPVSTSDGASWGALLRLAAGPIGDAALAWAFLAAAALPLVIGARFRLAWAGRAWSVAVVAWVLAWFSGRGWLGPVALSPQVMLAPAAVGIALAVGMGVAAFQRDLPGYRFGWRQAAAVAAAAAAAVGILPVLAASANGRWDLVSTGYAEATSWMDAHPTQGNFRVLWLGDPRVLPGNGWELSRGLAFSLSENGLPDVTALWPGSSEGQAATIGTDVGLARRGATVRLGRLLAPYAVRYVVVVDTLGPSIPGLQTPPADQPPGDVVPALAAQLDLREVISQSGFYVFRDDEALPLRAQRGATGAASAPSAADALTGVPSELRGWEPVLRGAPGVTSATGRVKKGTVLAAVAPAADWRLRVPGGRTERATTAFGYAATFPVTTPGTVTVGFAGSWGHGVEVALETLAWVVAAAALAGRRRWLDWWWTPLRRVSRRRLRGRAPGDDASSADAVSTGAPADGVTPAPSPRPAASVAGDQR